MGLLVQGKPLSWLQTYALRYYVKKHGILQFLNMYKEHNQRSSDRFLWGDEIECLLLSIDPKNKRIRIKLRAHEILNHLKKQQEKDELHHPGTSWNVTFHPEYGNFMLEVTPSVPYGSFTHDLRIVETNMRLRRALLQSALRSDEIVVTSSTFPLLGVDDFICIDNDTRIPQDGDATALYPIHHDKLIRYGPILKSSYVPDAIMSPHPRFATLSGNIRRRRQRKVNIQHPIYHDKYTNMPLYDVNTSNTTTTINNNNDDDTEHDVIPLSNHATSSSSSYTSSLLTTNERQSYPRNPPPSSSQHNDSTGNIQPPDEIFPSLLPTNDTIHMDAMGFGMGACCLQVTFQTRSNKEARYIHDQLAVLAPIFLALTANTPFHRGRIVDTDVRWNTISQAVDDRTWNEMGYTMDEVIKAKDQRLNEQNEYNINKISLSSTESSSQQQQQQQQQGSSSTPSSSSFSSRDKYPLPPSPVLSPAKEPFPDDIQPEPIPSPDTYTWVDKYPTLGVPVAPGETARIYKSRYSSIDMYLDSDGIYYLPEYNNLIFPYDLSSYILLRQNNIDELLSKHIASLFIRDPLVMFEGQIDVDDRYNINHFESLQSSNWRSVRYKPPPLPAEPPAVIITDDDNNNNSSTLSLSPPVVNTSPGWRVEFRTMEIQSTDFENAAFTIFIALLTRAICFFELNMYIPLSLVDDNFDIAHKNDAVRKEKFWFRNRVKPCPKCSIVPTTNTSTTTTTTNSVASSYIDNDINTPTTPGSSSSSSSNNNDDDDTLNTTTPIATPIVPAPSLRWEQSHIDPQSPPPLVPISHHLFDVPHSVAWEQMTMEEIVCGKKVLKHKKHNNNTTTSTDDADNDDDDNDDDNFEHFPGLLGIVRAYLDVIKCDKETLVIVHLYLSLIEQRATGKLLTGAQWQREYIINHPSYKHNSVLPSDSIYDLLLIIYGLANGHCTSPDLLGVIDPSVYNIKQYVNINSISPLDGITGIPSCDNNSISISQTSVGGISSSSSTCTQQKQYTPQLYCNETVIYHSYDSKNTGIHNHTIKHIEKMLFSPPSLLQQQECTSSSSLLLSPSSSSSSSIPVIAPNTDISCTIPSIPSVSCGPTCVLNREKMESSSPLDQDTHPIRHGVGKPHGLSSLVTSTTAGAQTSSLSSSDDISTLSIATTCSHDHTTTTPRNDITATSLSSSNIPYKASHESLYHTSNTANTSISGTTTPTTRLVASLSSSSSHNHHNNNNTTPNMTKLDSSNSYKLLLNPHTALEPHLITTHDATQHLQQPAGQFLPGSQQ